MEGDRYTCIPYLQDFHFNPLPPHGGRPLGTKTYIRSVGISIHSLRMEGDRGGSVLLFMAVVFQSTPSAWRETFADFSFAAASKTFQSTPSAWRETQEYIAYLNSLTEFQSTPSAWRETSKTAQESVFHFAYPCTILQKRMQKTTFCTRKNGFFRKKGEKFGAKPSASFCAPMIRTDTFPLNFSHRISGSSMSMVSFAPICSTFD